MYLCICNAITQKMLDNNHFLLEKIGSKCGKCIESGGINDGNRVTYLTIETKTATNCYDSFVGIRSLNGGSDDRHQTDQSND